jgi:hypothetical protein
MCVLDGEKFALIVGRDATSLEPKLPAFRAAGSEKEIVVVFHWAEVSVYVTFSLQPGEVFVEEQPPEIAVISPFCEFDKILSLEDARGTEELFIFCASFGERWFQNCGYKIPRDVGTQGDVDKQIRIFQLAYHRFDGLEWHTTIGRIDENKVEAVVREF